MITNLLNRLGLYTSKQYTQQRKELDKAVEYATYMEKVVCDMVDPVKPIVVLNDLTRVDGIRLRKGQQIIVSPYVKYIHISNVSTN